MRRLRDDGLRLARRGLLDNWPQKLGALALATLVWFLVSTNEQTTTQRSLLVPLAVEGVGERRVAVGLPEFVEVTVSGRSNRIDRLRPENIEAVLELTGLQGEFQQTIDVRPPQGIDLLRVNPEQVIGFLEQVSSKEVPVEVVWLQEPPPDVDLRATPEPVSISVSARDEILERVALAIAPVAPEPGAVEAPLFAADASGMPVREVTLSPAAVQIDVRERSMLVRREVGVALARPETARVEGASLTADTAVLLGPPSAVEGLESVTATVDPATIPSAPGRYTLAVRLDLPGDVSALESPSATVNVIDPSLPR